MSSQTQKDIGPDFRNLIEHNPDGWNEKPSQASAPSPKEKPELRVPTDPDSRASRPSSYIPERREELISMIFNNFSQSPELLSDREIVDTILYRWVKEKSFALGQKTPVIRQEIPSDTRPEPLLSVPDFSKRTMPPAPATEPAASEVVDDAVVDDPAISEAKESVSANRKPKKKRSILPIAVGVTVGVAMSVVLIVIFNLSTEHIRRLNVAHVAPSLNPPGVPYSFRPELAAPPSTGQPNVSVDHGWVNNIKPVPAQR